ncbi:hypothetical protein UT300012_23610 [Paraclostridium bifermentans]
MEISKNKHSNIRNIVRVLIAIGLLIVVDLHMEVSAIKYLLMAILISFIVGILTIWVGISRRNSKR